MSSSDQVWHIIIYYVLPSGLQTSSGLNAHAAQNVFTVDRFYILIVLIYLIFKSTLLHQSFALNTSSLSSSIFDILYPNIGKMNILRWAKPIIHSLILSCPCYFRDGTYSIYSQF